MNNDDLKSFESDIRSFLKEIDKDINNKFKLRDKLKNILLKIENKKEDTKGQKFLSNYK